MTKLTDERLAALKARYADTDNDVLAKDLGVPVRVIRYQAIRLGLKKRSPYPSKHGPNRQKKGRLPSEIETFMRDNFATTDDMSLARRLGVNDRTVRRWAKVLGLKKCRNNNTTH